MSVLRPATASDLPAILRWNEANVELLSPLDEARLTQLIAWSSTAAVIVHDTEDVGFVITFAQGSAYDSENYRWFGARHKAFIYLDRIVIDAAFRRTGSATRVYDELETEAAQYAEVFCLEVNIEPPNEPSLEFHRARGYVQVGRQQANGHGVALFEKQLG